MMAALKKYGLMALVSWAFILMPVHANAAYEVLRCDTNGGVIENTELYYVDRSAEDDGRVADEDSFCGQVRADRILSTIICNYTAILNSVLGKMYCGIQYTLADLVAILLTVYVVIFGVQILMGTAQLTAKEMVVRFFKIGLVWMFMSNSTMMVNLVFSFFIDAANQGIWWTLSSLSNNIGGTVVSSGALFDLGQYQNATSAAIPVYVYIDQLIYNVVRGPLVEENSRLIGFFAVMAFAIPPLFMVAAYWLWTTFMIVARTLISFMMSITAIAFLVALAPIFLCFMLFQATFQFFDSWLRFLVSYSLQSLIVFACVAMWVLVMMNFIGFFGQLEKIIFPAYKLAGVQDVRLEMDGFGICPYKITNSNTRLASATDPYPVLGPQVKCEDPTFQTDPEKIRNQSEIPKMLADQKKLIILSNIAPGRQDSASQLNDADPTATQHRIGRLIYFILYHVISLILVSYAFDALLKQSSSIAVQIAGPQNVPPLGQGWGGAGFQRIGMGGTGGAGRQGTYAREIQSTTPSSANDLATRIGGLAGRRD